MLKEDVEIRKFVGKRPSNQAIGLILRIVFFLLAPILLNIVLWLSDYPSLSIEFKDPSTAEIVKIISLSIIFIPNFLISKRTRFKIVEVIFYGILVITSFVIITWIVEEVEQPFLYLGFNFIATMPSICVLAIARAKPILLPFAVLLILTFIYSNILIYCYFNTFPKTLAFECTYEFFLIRIGI